MQKKRRQKRSASPAEGRDAPAPNGGSAKAAASERRPSICVFCGSGPGRNPAYVAAARELGRSMAASDVGLVYGGGGLGLMGEVGRATLEHGGRVTGIIPGFLREKELMLREVTELIVTNDMHERKRLMFERSDALVALPGGIGTLEELIEQMTWLQLGRHTKPIVLASIDGFWSPLLALLDHMREEAFIRKGLEISIKVVERAEEIVPVVLAGIAAAPQQAPGLLVPERF